MSGPWAPERCLKSGSFVSAIGTSVSSTQGGPLSVVMVGLLANNSPLVAAALACDLCVLVLEIASISLATSVLDSRCLLAAGVGSMSWIVLE